MRIFIPLALMLATATLSGCFQARIPEPATYPYTQQRKIQAAEHWEVLARDTASKINKQLVLNGYAQSPVFVEYNCGDDATPCKQNETSPFNEAFRDLLITSLWDYHIPVRVKPSEAALEIQFKVQIVRHDTHRIQTIQPGVITALSATVAVLRNAPESLVIMAAGAGADVANTTFTQHEHDEIIITTSMTEHGEYFFRSSDIYYINDPDFWHYLEVYPNGSHLNFSSRTLRQKIIDEDKPLIPNVVPVPPPGNTIPQVDSTTTIKQESI